MKLKDKVAIVTGGANGIGAATSLLFAREGARLSIWDVDETGLSRAAEASTSVLHLRVDVVDPRSVASAVEDTLNRYGRIDILINNAGINRDAISWKMTDEQWSAVVDVSLRGTFNCCRAVVPAMRDQMYGKIVNTSSISSLGNPGQANYSAAKAGVTALTKTLALEVASHGINVNCVAPGPIDTQMTRSMPPERLQKQLAQKIPLRRMGQPEDVARLHLFLASDDSSFITGQTIFIDGGFSVGM